MDEILPLYGKFQKDVQKITFSPRYVTEKLDFGVQCILYKSDQITLNPSSEKLKQHSPRIIDSFHLVVLTLH